MPLNLVDGEEEQLTPIDPLAQLKAGRDALRDAVLNLVRLWAVALGQALR